MTLSDVGQRIFPLVKALLSDAEQLELEIHGEAREAAGRVTIGSLPSITNPMVGRLFTQLRARYPRIQLEIVEGSSGQVEGTIVAALSAASRRCAHRSILLRGLRPSVFSGGSTPEARRPLKSAVPGNRVP
ncbi:LysR family transcriptional regulator [Variovorax paradoxus]|nr:LysR family transcriptional regulator [Variovorax paradoxus]